MTYSMIQKNKLSGIEQNLLWDGIEQFTQAIVGETGRHELCYLLNDDAGKVIGGVQGNYDNFGWLWIDSLWVSTEARGKGLGIQLLDKIENEAIKNGCKNVHLTSFTHQAVDFYIKQGYQIFGELADYPKGYSRCWLKKEL